MSLETFAVASPRASQPVDPFGDSFAKLAFLLSIPEDAPILQVGPPIFPHIGHLAEAGRYGLATWHRQGPEDSDFVPRLLEIRRFLSADAPLFLLADNPFDLRRAVRQPRNFCSDIRWRVPCYRQALRQAGFTQVTEFWALPCGQTPEEFLLRSPQAPPPRSVHGPFLKRLLQQLKLGHLLHDRFLYLASAPTAGIAATLTTLEGRLGGVGGSGSLVLERFDLRRRGALVMICKRSGGGSGRFVLRVAPSGDVAKVVGRNHQWITRLHGEMGLTATFKELIPRPLAEFTVQGAQVFAEEAMMGELAWKVVARKGPRRKVFAAACDFLWALQQGTAVRHSFGETLLDSLLPDAKTWPDRYASELGAGMTAILRRRLSGQRRLLVWGHGDFGYGNLLVDPRHGHLQGVIDWDTGATSELAGLDLVHLLVQKARIEERQPFPTALAEVGRLLLEKDPPAIASESACAMLQSLTIDNIKEILALCCLRFVHRSARYATLFAQDLHQNIEALTWALGLLDHDLGRGQLSDSLSG